MTHNLLQQEPNSRKFDSFLYLCYAHFVCKFECVFVLDFFLILLFFSNLHSALCKASTEEQRDFFVKRFILALDDRYSEVLDLWTKFNTRAAGGIDLDFVGASDFLQKNGKARTATQIKGELKDVDVDSNGRTSFIEYLLLHYKIMILDSYYKRKGVDPEVELKDDGVGLVGVGDQLILELYSPPLGMDTDLEKMMRDFAVHKRTREAKIAELEAIIAQGGVKAMATKAELDKLTAENGAELNHLEAKIKAATKKAEIAAEKMLAEKHASAEAAAAADKSGSRGKLAEKSAAFGS